ncbi:MAG TPA: endonuclease domain-containing protein [Stellaceae bacterium]|nr:endonuclease domain-containing protein [Stellaceae bacterium]
MRAIRTVERARRLRSNQTDVERLLWSRIRDRQLSGFKFRRQVPIGRYIVDFVCRERSLIIELDGGQHGSTTKYDAERTRWLEQHGWHLLRFWNNDVTENIDGVLETIPATVDAALSSPHPVPLPQAGEGDTTR